MTLNGNAFNYRYRSLTREQVRSIRSAISAGARPRPLADAYGVSVRTIYRALIRADCDVRRVTLDGWRADFEVGEEGPVRVTPWTPAP